MTSLAAMTLDESGGHRIGTGKSSALEEPSPDQSDSTDYGGLWLWEEGLGDDGLAADVHEGAVHPIVPYGVLINKDEANANPSRIYTDALWLLGVGVLRFRSGILRQRERLRERRESSSLY